MKIKLEERLTQIDLLGFIEGLLKKDSYEVFVGTESGAHLSLKFTRRVSVVDIELLLIKEDRQKED